MHSDRKEIRGALVLRLLACLVLEPASAQAASRQAPRAAPPRDAAALERASRRSPSEPSRGVAADTSPPPAPDVPVSPVEVWLACRSPLAEREPLRVFCHELRVPTRLRGLTEAERQRWVTAVPEPAAIRAAVDSAKHAIARGLAVDAELARLRFPINSAVADSGDLDALKAIARTLTEDRTIRVRLTGLASATGPKRVNDDLSERRAAFVRGILLDNGVLSEQVETESEGNRRSLAQQAEAAPTDKDREFDRRVDIQRLPPSAAVAAGQGARASAPRGGLTPEALLIGLTDYLITEAIRSVDELAMRTSLARLCNRTDTANSAVPYVKATCAAFAPETLVAQKYQPSVARLRSAIREDLAQLPITLTSQTLVGARRTPAACALLAGARHFAAVAEGMAPAPALQTTLAASQPVCHAALGDAYTRVTATINVIEQAQIELVELRPADRLTNDEAVAIAVKTLVVNTPKSQRLAFAESATRVAGGVAEAQRAWRDAAETVRSARRDGTKGDAVALMSTLVASGMPALEGMLPVLPDTMQRKLNVVITNVRDAPTLLAAARYQEAFSALMRAADAAEVELGGSVLGSLAFAADLAEAGSAEEVTAAFRRYNPGSRVVAFKRDSTRWYATLNGYAGVAAGAERSASTWAGAAALSLPIGAEIGWSLGQPGRPRTFVQSIGLFAQVIDLGSLAAIRIGGSDTLEKVPPPTLASVWAPGVMLRLGLGDSRFVATTGIAYVPAGRREETTETSRSAVRLTFGLATDIPLLTIIR